MPERDLSAVLADDEYRYPGIPSRKHPSGKMYRVASVSGEVGQKLTRQARIGMRAALGQPVSDAELASLQLDDDDERAFYLEVLGPTYQQMLDDGVKWTTIQAVAQDAFYLFTGNRAAADSLLAAAEGKQERPTAAKVTRAPTKKPAAVRKAPAKTPAA